MTVPTAPVAHAVAARRGATLVEVLLCGVVLTTGGAALLGAVAALVRGEREAARAARAVAVAAARLEELPGMGCAPASGAETVGGVAERWRVDTAGGLLLLADTVGTADGRPLAAVVGVARCAP